MLLGLFGGLFITLALILVVEITVAYLLHQGLKKIPTNTRARKEKSSRATSIQNKNASSAF